MDPAALFPLEEDAVLIDVREVSEYEEENIGGKNIPLSELENRLTDIPRNVPVYVHCQSGVRSRTAVRLLQDHGFRNVVQVRGGLAAILRYGVL
ncbi:MAG: rhodanese-like domain-containing protein [Siphonobacter aquaeclarae]|nr:rhodanese-like domain-containing protein [Siphonobacter aquaeclarae]